jgi:hypothetical protein
MTTALAFPTFQVTAREKRAIAGGGGFPVQAN